MTSGYQFALAHCFSRANRAGNDAGASPFPSHSPGNPWHGTVPAPSLWDGCLPSIWACHSLGLRGRGTAGFPGRVWRGLEWTKPGRRGPHLRAGGYGKRVNHWSTRTAGHKCGCSHRPVLAHPWQAMGRIPSMVRLLELGGTWPWLPACAQLARNKSPFVLFFCRQLIKRMLTERLQPY